VVTGVNGARVAATFGLGRVVRLSDGPVARGRQGVVWRLDTTDGSWAVKTTFEPVTEDEVAVAALLQESAYDAGVPTPEVRRATETGTVLATVDGVRLRVYGWADLAAPTALLDPSVVGDVLARIHRVGARLPTGGEPVHPWYLEPVGAAAWDDLVAELRAEGAPFAGRLADLRDELVALESWLEPPDDVQLCHRDLWADNVLPTADGGVCVIDWENSGTADPSQELGCALFEFGRQDAGRARALVAAYRSAGGPGAVTRRGHFSMLVAQLGHITEIAARDWLAPNDRSPHREAAAAWIGEVLEEPHTREVLDTLLTVVSGQPAPPAS
jgi:Ser/Thr protein kinase RdoA (MazF antagonist)